LRRSGVVFDLEGKKQRVTEIQELLYEKDNWVGNRAVILSKELSQLESYVGTVDGIYSGLQDARDLFIWATEEEDTDTLREIFLDVAVLKARIGDLETLCMFSEQDDMRDAVIEIHAGTGGTEAQWWAEQLMRMYLLWFKKRGFEAELLDTTFGDESGIKSATISISGHFPYGWVRTETGIHRLSRVSEFDSSGRRHTSFAAVCTYPYVDDTIEVDIQKADLEFETFRATGPGGQHVNTTDSAVRIRHRPSGIVVSCQNERSQRQNKERAMKLLYSKLYNLEIEIQKEQQQKQHKQKTGISWGHQIRSYIFNPYRMVKDHRTGKEIGDVDSIMNGCLDSIIRDYLLSKKGGNTSE
jgi:peptide chain release factor 2